MTDDELGVLRLAHMYGAGLDLSGPRVGKRVKSAARECVRQNWMHGKLSNLCITETGKEALHHYGVIS